MIGKQQRSAILEFTSIPEFIRYCRSNQLPTYSPSVVRLVLNGRRELIPLENLLFQFAGLKKIEREKEEESKYFPNRKKNYKK